MNLAYEINLFIHAAAGLLALVVLAVPLVAKKGGPLHRRAGWLFTAAMAVVTITGLALALAWFVDPLRFKPLPDDATLEQIAQAERFFRAYALFFATVALMSGSAVWQGIAAVRLEAASLRPWPAALDHIAWLAPALAGLALLLVGLRLELPLFMAFGGLAVFNGVSEVRTLLRPLDRKGAWLIRHLQAMLGGATVALTAFAVLVLRRYLDPDGGFQLMFWLVPVAVGIFGTVVWTRIYERRLGYDRPRAVAR